MVEVGGERVGRDNKSGLEMSEIKGPAAYVNSPNVYNRRLYDRISCLVRKVAVKSMMEVVRGVGVRVGVVLMSGIVVLVAIPISPITLLSLVAVCVRV